MRYIDIDINDLFDNKGLRFDKALISSFDVIKKVERKIDYMEREELYELQCCVYGDSVYDCVDWFIGRYKECQIINIYVSGKFLCHINDVKNIVVDDIVELDKIL